MASFFSSRRHNYEKIALVKGVQIPGKQPSFPLCPLCLATVLSCLPPKNPQTLDKYSRKMVRGAMGCDVSKRKFDYSRIR